MQAAFALCGFVASVPPFPEPAGGAAVRVHDYIVVLGAGIVSLRARLDHLLSLWQAGAVRGRALVFHTGARALTASERASLAAAHPASAAASAAETEADMMLVLFDALAGVMPESLRELPLYVVDAPEYADGPGGAMRRPTTRSCAAAWVAGESTSLRGRGGGGRRGGGGSGGPGGGSGSDSEPPPPPSPGSVVAVSNQPYVRYQYCVLRAVLAEAWGPPSPPAGEGGRWALEAVGPGAAGELPVPLTLDTVCRLLFEEERAAPGRGAAGAGTA